MLLENIIDHHHGFGGENMEVDLMDSEAVDGFDLALHTSALLIANTDLSPFSPTVNSSVFQDSVASSGRALLEESMAPVLPSSLSPHVCILPSPDLSELLESSALPPLQNILQSFSPLPQVTTRTTALVSVPHSSFALRFSDLAEVEEACREPEEQRALRSLDWIAARINKRCEKWVQDMEERGERELSRVSEEDRLRTPWWDEVRRCAEGDFVPDRYEGWNHPVALILAVSTTASNPLQAITSLYSRNLQFPSWVDTTNVLRYILIVHPQNSPFSDEEANALFNAVKKQYGLHSYLLSLDLPTPPPAPIPVPALLPRLPPPSVLESPQLQRRQPPPTPVTPNNPGGLTSPHVLNTLQMMESDIQSTARFAREFVVMSLIPWMEKCVVEWNESYSSTRRLPSRLFSSTRRLFGSPSPSPAPGHTSSASVSSLPGRSASLPINGGPAPPSPHRRLAEFATILGDFKLAGSVWESLRKESKGGSDMLPLLSAPSPALHLHASNALAVLHPPTEELPPHIQLRALLYCTRWEAGIDPRDLLSDALEGERWLVWAAGNAEEVPAALLLAHAALLSSMRKRSYRRAALWYVTAASRLEKCGIKPLTIYFLRKARELYEIRPTKELSPSFWDSENKSESNTENFVDVRSGIEYPLGRLLYTTGHVAEAVRLFLDILRGSPYPTLQAPVSALSLEDGDGFASEDKSYLDDFRVAFAHMQSTEPEAISTLNLTIPLKFCQPKQCKIRFPGESTLGDASIWERREEEWRTFQKAAPLVTSKKVCANEYFWVDLALSNPLAAEVNLSNVTLVVETKHAGEAEEPLVDIEVVQEVVLSPKETRNIPITLKCSKASTILISAAKFDFLALLPVTESLSHRGRRLHDTQAQRITPTYAPDVQLKIDVAFSQSKLAPCFVEDHPVILKQGETRELGLWLLNAGETAVQEIWVLTGSEHEVWLGNEGDDVTTSSKTEIIRSSNSFRASEPHKVSLAQPLLPNERVNLSVLIHGQQLGAHDLLLFFAYRESDSTPFHSARLGKSFEVESLLDVEVSLQPSRSQDHSFILNVEMTSSLQSTSLNIKQISTISPSWKFKPIFNSEEDLAPSQSGRFAFGAEQWLDGEGKKESLEFVSKELGDVLQGNIVPPSDPPEIDLICSHLLETPTSQTRTFHSGSLQTFLHSGRRRYSSDVAAQQHPHIPSESHPNVFPLYNPLSVDLMIFWEIPSQKRQGHIAVYGNKAGAAHAALNDIFDKAENSKVKRSMYAQTVREKKELFEGIRTSEWNAEMDPIGVSVQDVGQIEHDFSKGPCHVPLSFLVRNHSPLFDAQVTLKLRGRNSDQLRSDLLSIYPAPYSGRLTFRTTVSAFEFVILQPRLLITRPGLYNLGGWALETEVLVEQQEGSDPDAKVEQQHQQRYRYVQEQAPSNEACIVVRDLGSGTLVSS